jgi:hypothetical protein
MRMRPESVIERNFHVGQGPIIQLRHTWSRSMLFAGI